MLTKVYIALLTIGTLNIGLLPAYGASFTYVGRILTDDDQMNPVENAKVNITFEGGTFGNDKEGPFSANTNKEGIFIVHEDEAPPDSFLFHLATLNVEMTNTTQSGKFHDRMETTLDVSSITSSLGLNPSAIDVVKALIEGKTGISFLPNLASTEFVGAVGSGIHKVSPKPVPEPLTILGSATALGFGALLKRESSKKQNKKEISL